MDAEQTASPSQPAILHLLGQAAIQCTVLGISASGINIGLNEKISLPALGKGDLAEVHIHNFGKLKIRTLVESVSANSLQLNFINAQDSNVRQLVNWFGQAIPAKHSINRPAASTIINELTELTLEHSAISFDLFLQKADERLLSMAETAINNDQQNKLFEAKALLRKKGDRINLLYNQLFKLRIENVIADKPSKPDQISAEYYENMELINIDEFEDWLSIDSIIKRANERFYQPLACLEKRYGKLLNKEIRGEQLPVSIHNMCYTLQDTFKQQKVSPELMPVIYRLFDENVISQQDSLFDKLNAKLKNYDILPNIGSQTFVQRRSHRRATTRTDSTPPNQNNTESEEPRAIATSTNNHSGLFHSAQNILNLLNASGNGNVDSPATAINPQLLIENLSALQHDHHTTTGDLPLSNWLQSNNIPLNNETQGLMTLVDSIFQNISQYPQIPSPLISQIKRLEVPIAKAALLDNEFFSSADHPAKLLLNQLINLCLNSDMPNQALEKKVGAVIYDITENYQQDTKIFEQAVNELAATATQQQNAYQRNTDRITQTYDGRQRVKHAQDAVEIELQRRVSPPQAPEIVIDLIENGWRELLKLTYIKLGHESKIWREQLDTLDQLLQWVTETEDGQQNGITHQKLEADSFSDLIGQQLNNIFPGDYRYQNTVEKIRDTLKGLHPIIMVPLNNPDELETSNQNELQKELEVANPQLSRWFKRAKNLTIGDEFSYLGDDTGQRNIKLAWASDNQQHFIFVNNRGQKVLDFDLVDLATALSKGLAPVEKNSEWPLVERSLYSTVQQAYEKLAFKSTHDELTGLINRKEAEQLLVSALLDAKNKLQNHCLLYIDIDKFSLINSLHGHVAGDQLLIDVSKKLSEEMPNDAEIARMAGNEFVILVKNIDAPEGVNLANSIRERMAQHTFHWQQHPVQITISIGLMVINKYTENVVDLIRNAVSACQTVKDHGGNRVHDFRQDADLHERREKLLSWIDKLSNVLNSDKLVLRGQKISPLSDLQSESHYEILLAIKDDDGELTSPIEFIEAAECYNRMQRVDRWVIENTFMWLNDLKNQGIQPPAVSINLSGNSLNDDQFMDFILEKFAQYKVPTDKVCFEVTETATINNLAEAADFIREIKKLGCKFSLDDFGSGNASYQYLKHLPVDYLKIDGMFVQDIDNNDDDFALVKSIHEIAHLMGKKTIAEYAETDQIIDKLRDIGVDYVQGFAISKPTPLSDITQLIK